MGRPRALVAVVAGAFLLAGCGSGPSQVGAAAIVGDHSVSIDRVQDLINKAVREQPYAQKLASEHKLDQLGRAIVGQLVVHELLTQIAEKEGIAVNYGQVDAQLKSDPLTGPVPADSSNEAQAVSQVVARTRDHREELTDTYLAQALAEKKLPNLSVTFDYTSIGSMPSQDGSEPPQGPAAQKAAYDLARQFAADPAAVAKRITGDAQYEQQLRQQAAQAGQNTDSIPPLTGVGEVQPAAQVPALATTPLFGSPANSVTVFPYPNRAGTWFVGVVRQRVDDRPVATEQAPALDATTKTAIGMRQLQPYADKLGVRVNARYGVWDVVGMSVVANQDTAQGLVLPLGGAAPTQQ
ncbi:SurA N-terminal domain-containing protein [Amycolatopsis sp. OK19-0408]|uniref:SurA N-terminal domain-containing protein n=1 Tax=Amycolatopsis iheyensis TaxID=2945988 RepID=A0A9X2NIR0_9PSEU|nr:SurA N-terminal domain-containing protein [Amycolatopsis iheyensis]MCR6487247.1 SurA N-terminal domain-containing protein [Amycolatopsis iheyensis]